ncbi:MAG TPA: NUDIX domain-containing protein [Homoserinimonas sp.]|nr:NUDIX domain-containing protein [Homoserinimonas sp.]
MESIHQVVCGLLVRENTALLALRSATKAWYPGVWDLPGGHVETGESTQQALVRELWEELGIEVAAPITEPLLRLQQAGEDLSIWRIDSWNGTVRNAAPEEHDEIGWFSLHQSRQLDIASTDYRRMLERELS